MSYRVIMGLSQLVLTVVSTVATMLATSSFWAVVAVASGICCLMYTIEVVGDEILTAIEDLKK